MPKQIFSALKITVLALTFSFGISYVYAWTAPIVTPPNGNVSAPINTSATSQYKEGALGIGGILRGYANAIFDGSVGIGTPTPGSNLEVNAGSATLTKDILTVKGGGSSGAYGFAVKANNNDDLFKVDTLSYNVTMVNGGAGNVGIGTPTPQKKLEIKGDHSSTQARFFSDNYGQGIDGANTAVMSLWASEPGWTWGGVGIGNNINGSPYYGRVTNTRGGSYIRLLDNSISLHTLNSSGTDTGGLDVTNGSVTATSLNTGGTVTATGNIQGQHIKFPGVGGDSGAGADFYGIYQESGPWSYPYPDLRIQYHTGIKYDAYAGYGGHQFYTGYDQSGTPTGLQMQITDKVYVSNDVCTTAGKCLSTAGGGGIKATTNVGPTGVNDGGAGWDADCPAGYVMSGLRIVGNSMTVRCAQI